MLFGQLGQEALNSPRLGICQSTGRTCDPVHRPAASSDSNPRDAAYTTLDNGRKLIVRETDNSILTANEKDPYGIASTPKLGKFAQILGHIRELPWRETLRGVLDLESSSIDVIRILATSQIGNAKRHTTALRYQQLAENNSVISIEFSNHERVFFTNWIDPSNL